MLFLTLELNYFYREVRLFYTYTKQRALSREISETRSDKKRKIHSLLYYYGLATARREKKMTSSKYLFTL